MNYAVVDIETTGSFSRDHGITEVAIVLTDGEKVLDQYTTLINPHQHIPRHITALTNITNEMVEQAPDFDEVMDKIDEMTKDHIFVAHNVFFDYNFLRKAFKLRDRKFQRKKLCTVRLARKVFTGLSSYSLGNLCRHFDIHNSASHRAWGDAEATTVLLHKMIEADEDSILLTEALNRLNREATLPPNLDKEIWDAVPEDTGVYYFHDKKGKVIYVGKALNIKNRLVSHFTSKSRKQELMKREIFDVSWEITGSDLVAYLLESEEIKRNWPKYNSVQKFSKKNYILFEYIDQKGYRRLAFTDKKTTLPAITVFNNFEQARTVVSEMVEEYELCPKLCSLQKTVGACYDNLDGKCKGACIGTETKKKYHKKLDKAIEHFNSMDTRSFLIEDEGRTYEEKSIIVVEKGKYLGYAYIDKSIQVRNAEEATMYIQPRLDNRDVQSIIRNYVNVHSVNVHFY